MIRDLIPWTQLTRFGIPPTFRVIRRPIVTAAKVYAVGTIVSGEDIFLPAVRRSRLRQMYEARLLEPVVAPKGSRQAHRRTIAVPVPVSVIPDLSIPVAEIGTGTGIGTSYVPPRSAVSRKGASSK